MNSDYAKLLSETEDELNRIKTWVNKNARDAEASYLINYSVIKSSGTIEVVFKSILVDYLSNEALPETSYYLEKTIIESSINPKTGNICKLLEKINPDWKNQFSVAVNGSGKKSDLNSLVQLRNGFAHGERISVTITTVINYYKSACEIMNILDNVIN
ncbi:hypothetical protein SDC9_70754 [bioreactor metagenome]|uniref:RiboL-PSP-HEPN domain-containing protein n=1 Tax=bioreactor metagenome TaxID=1076179 RepID=A0A644YCL8_9ZZZZ